MDSECSVSDLSELYDFEDLRTYREVGRLLHTLHHPPTLPDPLPPSAPPEPLWFLSHGLCPPVPPGHPTQLEQRARG